MNAIQYDARDIYNQIVCALKKDDIDTLVECDKILEEHNDKHVLLMLYPKEYEKYHELLAKTSVEDEVSARIGEIG